ncbi:MAG TPA: retroviral-like aspartic protease family protein [Sphingomonas sp.]|nr:retroviral-like aspartic protease family protein [Sphingomonas sp.]
MVLSAFALSALLLSAASQPAPSPAAPAADEAIPLVSPPPPDISDLPAGSTAVKLIPVETRMSVEVMINGAGPFPFIVDSGASRTVISGSLARLLGLPSNGPVQIHSVGGTSTVPSVRIDRLSIGGLPPSTIMAPVLRENDLGALGILGIDVLADKRVVLDFDKNRMTIERAVENHPRIAPNEIVVTAKRRFGQLVLVNADADGQHIYAIVDTGSAVTIGNTSLRSRLLHHRDWQTYPVKIHDVTGREVPAIYGTAGDIRIGSIKVRHIVAAFCDADAFDRFQLRNKPAMLLGMDLLRGFRRVSIDFANKRVALLLDASAIDARPVMSISGR